MVRSSRGVNRTVISRTVIARAAAALGGTLAGVAQASPPSGSANNRLIFADEFNGTSLDTSKWVAGGTANSPGWTMPNSDSTATASDVSVGNGVLTLTANRPTAAASFNSGSISSYGLYNFTSGYVEARIDLPSTPGSWPAFWGLYDNWPPEADIMEYPLTTDGGKDGVNTNQYNTNYHYTNTSGSESSGAGIVNTGSNLGTSGWHTFGMDWTSSTSVVFYLDGTAVSSYYGSSVAQMASMYMILDYAVGGWPGTPSTTQWPVGWSDQMQVDYVRVYQSNPNADAPTAWTVNGGGSLATSGNWTQGVPKYSNETAVFGRVGTATTAAISLAPWQVMGGLVFNGSGGATTAYTIGGSSNAIQLANTAGSALVQATSSSTVNQTVNANLELWSNTSFINDMTTGTTLNINGVVSGAGVLTATGVGTTILSGSNTYAGGTAIGAYQGAGVLRVTNGAALGTGAVTLDLTGNGSTARLELAGGITVPNNITFPARTNASVGIESVSGNNTLAGTITTSSGGNVYLIQSDAGTLTLSGAAAGATAAGVALQAGSSGTRTFTLQGAGNGAVTGLVQNGSGAVSVSKAGTGTWTLGAANTYSGDTTVLAGRLVLAHAGSTSTASLNVSTGATLAPLGALTTSGVLQSAGTLDLTDGAIATLSAGSLNLTSATLDLQLGAGTTSDRVASAGAAALSGVSTVNLSAAPGQSITSGTAYTLVTAASGLTAGNFALGTKPASLNFTQFALSTPTAGSLVVTATGNPTPTTAYWTAAGSLATGDATNSWGAGAAVNTSNWSTDPAGRVDAKQLPGSITNVVLNAANAPASGATSTTQLDAAYAIAGLTFNVGAATVTSAVLNTNGYALLTGSGGVTLAATSNASATVGGTGAVQLTTDQAWANQNNGASLTIAAGVTAGSGPAMLSFNGTGTGGVNLNGVLADGGGQLSTTFNQAGTTLLSAANTYTGTTTVAGGTVEIAATGSVAGNVTVTGGTLRLTDSPAAIAPTATVNLQAGTLDVRSATAGTAATASLGALTGGGTLTRSTAGVTAVTIGTSGLSGTFSGAIQDGAGQLALVKAGTGTLTLAGSSSFTGGTTIDGSGGFLLVTSASALGTGPVTIGQGGTNDTGELQLAGNISLAGVTTINLDSRYASNASGSAHIENLSGNNTISANLNINNTGGSAANILSTSGTLTLAGNLSSTGLSSARGFDFYGAGNGVVTGVIADGTAQPTFVQKDGTGTWTLAGNNAYTGSTTVNGGTLGITGTNTLGGGVQIGSGSTLVLSGADTLKPTANTLILHDGGTLQLQANPGNTTTSMVSGVPISTSNVLNGIANDGSDNAFKFTDTDYGQATLQLRGDQNVTFNDTSFHNGVGNTTLNYDVNNLNGDGTQGVTLSVGSILSFNTAVNVSGNPTYTLNFGGVTNALAADTKLTVNSANLVTGPIGAGGSGKTLELNASGGNLTATGAINMTGAIAVTAAAGYKVTLNGPVSNGSSNTSVSFSGAGTLVLNGADTYAGGTTVTGGVLAGTGSVTSRVTIAGATITAGSGATRADSIGRLTTTGGQNWSSGSFVDKVASTVAGAGTGNDLLVMSSLTVPTPASFAVSLLTTNGSSPGFTASNATLTSTPVAGSYIVLATDSEGAGSPFHTPAVVAALNLDLTVSGVATKSAGDSIQLDGYFDGSNYDLIAEDVAATPEPTSLALMSLAVALPLGRRRRR